MMNGLKKCFGYGKLLKQLFIILLISCSFLLVNSSVNAGYYNYGESVSQFGNNDCRIGSNLGISCTKSSYLLSSYDSGYRNDISALFWTSDGIGFYYKNNRTNESSQGLINTGFYICSGDFTNVNSSSDILFMEYPYCSSRVLIGSYQNLVNKLLSKNPLYVGTFFPSGYGTVLSLVYDDFYFTVFIEGGGTLHPNGNYVLKDMGVSGQDYDTLTFGNNVLYSPIGDFPASIPDLTLTGDSEEIYFSDNNKVYYDFFECLGFTSDICYSNFSIDNVVDSNTTYFDLFPSGYISGSTVFDLYNSWEYNFNPFNAWFNYYKNRYFIVENDKSNNSVLSMYSGVSKGNYYLFNKLENSYYISSYQFNLQDYYIYCDMVVNGFNPDGLFTGNTSISFNNLFISSDVRSDNSICSNGQFNYYLSGSNFAFPEDTDIVGVFNKLYTQFKNAFYVDSSKTGTIGFLPRYIILGFFLFLLLYILKR